MRGGICGINGAIDGAAFGKRKTGSPRRREASTSWSKWSLETTSWLSITYGAVW